MKSEKLKTESGKQSLTNASNGTEGKLSTTAQPSPGLRPPSPAPAGEGHGGGRKRPPLERVHKICRWLHDGKYPNCSTIAAAFQIGIKTAHRDIDFMRDRMGLPIEYDGARFGYYFTRPVDGFLGASVTERELFALCVAQKAIEQYQGTALQRPLELAFEKCMGPMDDQERFTLQNLDEVLSFRPFAPEDADLRLFELVTQALRERRVLQFEYRKPGEKVADVRRVRPYHLVQFSQRWYLLAHDLERSEIRKFVLGRMRKAVLMKERFEVPADFDAKKFLDRSFGMMTGAGDYEVVIEMDPWLTDVLRGRRWHPTQDWTEMPCGGSRLRMRLSCLEEIEQWVLSWGTHATVLRPHALVERIAKSAAELVEWYGVGMQNEECRMKNGTAGTNTTEGTNGRLLMAYGQTARAA